MSSSPILWGPNSIAANLENGVLQANGMLNSQQGPVNYISYGNFANNATTGWSLGTVGTLTNGIPTGTPTFGSGSTALTLATAASSQSLSGYALSLVAASATTVGNMMATQAYTIATEDQAKVLTFKFYYSTPSGVANCNFSGTSSNSFGIAIWDTTNSVWLSSTANFGMTQSSGVGYVTGTCQTNSTTASLQFVVYAVNATAGAATLYFTDFYLGPQTAPIGAVVTDWQPYTMTITGTGSNPTKGTIAVDLAEWRRVGGDMHIRYQYRHTAGGTAGTGTYLFALPSGYSMDATKITFDTVDFSSVVGAAQGQQGGAGIYGTAIAWDSTHLAIVGTYSSGSAGLGFTPLGASFVSLASTAVGFGIEAIVPITGWSSNVQMSSDTDTRVVASQYTTLSSTTITSGTALSFTTATYDSSGSLSSGTTFTVPVSGYYKISCGGFFTTAASLNLDVFVNGSSRVAKMITVNSTYRLSASGEVKVNAGDTITLVPGASGTAADTNGYFSVERLSGPSVIAATETVSLSYYGYTSGITGTSNATVLFATKVKDTHNGYASGIYTVPVTGMYHVNAGLLLATSGTPVVGTTFADLQIVQAGSASQVLEDKCFIPTANTTIAAAGYPLIVAGMLYCLAGDTIKVQGSVNLATASAAASNTMNFFSVARVGN